MNCKFCQKPLVLEADPACPPEWLERLTKVVACCARCGDYYWERNQLVSRCRNLAWKQSQNPAEKTFKHLVEACRRLAAITCDYWHVRLETGGIVWDEDFPRQLVDHPDKVDKICRVYLRGIREMAKRPT